VREVLSGRGLKKNANSFYTLENTNGARVPMRVGFGICKDCGDADLRVCGRLKYGARSWCRTYVYVYHDIGAGP